MLTTFYKVPAEKIGWFLLPFAAGNFPRPLLLVGAVVEARIGVAAEGRALNDGAAPLPKI